MLLSDSTSHIVHLHIELIKLRKDEIMRLNSLVVYIMIGLGAGLLSQPNIQLGVAEKSGLVLAFVGLGIYFVYRVASCLLSIHYSVLLLRNRNILSHRDASGLQFAGWHLIAYGLATLVIAGVTALLVNALIVML